MNVEELYLETTTLDEGHVHTFHIEDGNGETLKTLSLEGRTKNHIHKIENYIISENEAHIHTIKPEVMEEEKKEEPVEEIEEGVKEIFIILNTGEDAVAEYITENINGKLGSIIIDSSSQINLKITLAKYDGVVLYERQGYFGQKYLSLRNDSTFSNNEKAQSNGSDWILNDKLKINIEGPINTSTSFSIRYS